MTDNINFSEEVFNELPYETPEGYVEVSPEVITDQSRWNTYFRRVIKEESSGKFYRITWGRGSTESQDFGPEDIQVIEVFPKEKTVIVYESKP